MQDKSLANDKVKLQLIQLTKENKMSVYAAATVLGIPSRTCHDFMSKTSWQSWWGNYDHPTGEVEELSSASNDRAKLLYFDVETAPISAAVWGLWDNNVSLNMVQRDWYLLSFCAKWAHSDEIIYFDKRGSWDNEDDSELLEQLWLLLDEADIVIGQNSKKFDEKKVNARFILNGMKPPSHYRSIDTMLIAKRHFGFTSNKLEYMTDKLCKKYKKLTHGKFAGYELWKQCLRGNLDAWDEMQEYNVHDVLSLEELYGILRPYFKANHNLNVYTDSHDFKCVCGEDKFTHNGYHYTNASKFDRFKCDSCGASVRGKINLLTKEKRASLKANIV